MNTEELKRTEEWFVGYVRSFYERDSLPGPLEYKRVHSARVAENAEEIAKGLDLPPGETALARAAGLLHDVGRFSQYARFSTFMDADSLDHGAEGRRVLEEKASGIMNGADFGRLLTAVEFHNRKHQDIPGNLAAAEQSLLKLVRDADKIDILETLVSSVEEDGFQGLLEMLPTIKLDKSITPGVLESVHRGETLAIGSLLTLGDIIVMAAGWFYDINYGPARRLAASRGFLSRLRGQLPPDPLLASFFSGLEKAVSSPGAAYSL